MTVEIEMKSVWQQVKENEEQLVLVKCELDEIRATLIMNYGPKSGRPIIKDLTSTTLTMMVEVLKG